jgi:hypothetical protein
MLHTGRHGKASTLLNDEHISAAMRLWLRSNKWSMDPAKLRAYVENTMLPDARDKYCREVARDLMPKALCGYLELQLFPRIGVKVKKSISIHTARRWMRKEGFAHMRCSKGVYIDGHERGDVVEYRQGVFLPKMLEFRALMREYEVGDEAKEVEKDRDGHKPIVVVYHDESTFTANDAKGKTWVLNNEHELRKKGAGRGIHRSDFICSTVGWLREAGVSMEYGKAHEGYWNGQLLCQQVSNALACCCSTFLTCNLLWQLKEKAIPEFERHHPDCTGLFIFDNSSGHSAYAPDALRVANMNLGKGGKKGHNMRAGWFLKREPDGTLSKVVQPMCDASGAPRGA